MNDFSKKNNGSLPMACRFFDAKNTRKEEKMKMKMKKHATKKGRKE